LKGAEKSEVEVLFSQLPLIGGALFAAGLLIIYSGIREEKNRRGDDVNASRACWIGAVQGLCLPFRGFSRSGATISTGLLLGIGKRRMEEFSFALAVVLTPPLGLNIEQLACQQDITRMTRTPCWWSFKPWMPLAKTVRSST
jgi:undecaprenyl-diphosphatase